MRAVGRLHDYAMRPPQGGWDAHTWTSQIGPAYERAEREVEAELMATILARTLAPGEADLLHAHLVWERVAQRTGLRYLRRKVKR